MRSTWAHLFHLQAPSGHQKHSSAAGYSCQWPQLKNRDSSRTSLGILLWELSHSWSYNYEMTEVKWPAQIIWQRTVRPAVLTEDSETKVKSLILSLLEKGIIRFRCFRLIFRCAGGIFRSQLFFSPATFRGIPFPFHIKAISNFPCVLYSSCSLLLELIMLLWLH